MQPRSQIPVYNKPDDHQFKRHHTAKIICTIFVALLLVMGIITLILWLSIRPHRPRFHVRDFSIRGLAQRSRFQNAKVVFNITAWNSNKAIGIYYDDPIKVTLYHNDQSIGGTSLLFPFYQQPKNTTVLYGELSGATLTVNKNSWMQFREDLQGVVIFTLNVTSTIRFKLPTRDSKHHKMQALCEVGVRPDGSLSANYEDNRCPVYFTR